MTITPRRLAVLASGSGSNLQAILEYLEALGSAAPAAVVLVASNRAGALALERAGARRIATEHIVEPTDGAALRALLARHEVDMIALAGYLKFVPSEVTGAWRGAIVNIHPALLPKFGGPGMYGSAVHQAVIDAHERESGATVHFVDDHYDRGAAIARSRVPVARGDSVERLAARVLAVEQTLYPRAVHAVAAGWISLDGDGRAVVSDRSALATQFQTSAFPIEFLATPPFARPPSP